MTPLVLNRFLAMGVGSLPHTESGLACRLIFKHLKQDIPFWPQLPKRNFKENMYVQFSQTLPGAVIDEAGQRIWIDALKDDYSQNVEALYEHYLADDLDYFAIGKDYARGFYEFLNCLKAEPCSYIKGHIIGPISFGLTVSSQDKKASIYNLEFRDCLVKALEMKARWQVREMKSISPSSRVIICIDEPYLVSIGSSFFNIQNEEVSAMLNDVVKAIHKEGACAAVHCCGNTDWGIVLKTDIDILNFDAYNYLETIFIYREELENFLKRKGLLAFGIIPNSAQGQLPEPNALLDKIGRQDNFCLVSPSCGLSGVSEERADEVLALTSNFSRFLDGIK